MNKKILWITRTAVLIALLIVLQWTTSMLGNQLITGSVVNLMLIVSVMTCGLSTGISVAAVSNTMAYFLGIGPQQFWLIPFITAGNIVFVLLWHYVGNWKGGRKLIPQVIALIAAAIAKFLVLYVGVVQIAVPLLLGLPEKQASVISGMFSFLQLFTATIGGVLAIVLLPPLKKAIKTKPSA